MSNSSPFSGGPKAIETLYNGYRFRSRLEARWAVFFGTLDIRYEYEPEGYDLGDAGWYLPDFWLKDLQMWLEVKGRESQGKELEKCEALFRATDHPVLLAIGEPCYGKLWLYCNDATESSGGETWWGDCAWIKTRDDGVRVGTDYFRDDRNLLDGKWEPLKAVVDTGFVERYADNIDFAADEARQARFEHGENGRGT